MVSKIGLFKPMRKSIIELIQIIGIEAISSGYKKQTLKDLAHSPTVQISEHSPPEKIEKINPNININNMTINIAVIPFLSQYGFIFKCFNIFIKLIR